MKVGCKLRLFFAIVDCLTGIVTIMITFVIAAGRPVNRVVVKNGPCLTW